MIGAQGGKTAGFWRQMRGCASLVISPRLSPLVSPSQCPPQTVDSDRDNYLQLTSSSPTKRCVMAYSVLVHVEVVVDRGPLCTDLLAAYLSDEGVNLTRCHVFDAWRGRVDGTCPGDRGRA